ncbi:glyoxylate/hydroxypyruvate reductase A [uncultured Maribacter sp.]|uniref:2-hydroxyacid dehydrogenase n=1 Tax=uncultured Maribacter sp. TaxID=431308 RepID=UPI00262EAB6B|nr:glyoxylate/hydroxypyruvate reductase A [uncultured Maribacter sp.]
MSIAIIFENKNPIPWKKALKKRLPNTTIEIYPNVKNKEAVDFVICWKPIKNVFEQFPNIKIIQSVGASIQHITASQTINDKSIITRIVDEKLSNDMWEFLLTIVLSELKNIKTYKEQEAKNTWKQHNYKTVDETTISILGLGKIGGYVAEKFAQFGFNVKGWSNSKKQIPNVKSYNGESEFNNFLKNSNFLINLLPLTDKTKGILNKNTFQKLSKNSFLINVGRGEHLVDADLIYKLDDSTLSGAFLDVFTNEPLPREHPFWKHPKIQITPHIASLTNVETATEQILENYRLFLKNEELINVVSLKKGY